MTEFSTKAMLEVQPDERSLRDARNTIENRVGSVRTQVATDGGRRQSGLGTERLSRENAMSRQLLTAQLERLDEIHNEIEKLASSGLGGGGGGGGGFWQGLGVAGAASKGKGALGSVVSLLTGLGAGGSAAVGGGLLAGFAGAAGLEHVRQNSSWSPIQDLMNRGKKTNVPSDFSMSDTEAATLGGRQIAPSLKQIGEAFNLKKPEWMNNPFKGWSNPMQNWSIPNALSSGVKWPNPFQNWSMPSWLDNLFGGKKNQPPTAQELSNSGVVGGRFRSDLYGKRQNRAKNRGGSSSDINIQMPQVNLDPSNLKDLERQLRRNVVDEVLNEVRNDIGGFLS